MHWLEERLRVWDRVEASVRLCDRTPNAWKGYGWAQTLEKDIDKDERKSRPTCASCISVGRKVYVDQRHFELIRPSQTRAGVTPCAGINILSSRPLSSRRDLGIISRRYSDSASPAGKYYDLGCCVLVKGYPTLKRELLGEYRLEWLGFRFITFCVPVQTAQYCNCFSHSYRSLPNGPNRI